MTNELVEVQPGLYPEPIAIESATHPSPDFIIDWQSFIQDHFSSGL